MFIFHMNFCSIEANSLQDAIWKAEKLYPNWKYKYCYKVDKA